MRDFLSDIKKFQESHEFKQCLVSGVQFRYILCGEGSKTLTLLTGGHLAPILQTERYVKEIDAFMLERTDYGIGKIIYFSCI